MYKFIRKIHDNDGPILAVPAEKFTEQNLADLYDQYGQVIGSYNAGDYSLDNSASAAHEACGRELPKALVFEFASIDPEENLPEDWDDITEKVRGFIAKWRKENESLAKVEALTYWDGHNWQSVILPSDFAPEAETHEEVSEASECAEVLRQIERLGEERGIVHYSAPEGWKVTASLFQGAFEDYRMERV